MRTYPTSLASFSWINHASVASFFANRIRCHSRWAEVGLLHWSARRLHSGMRGGLPADICVVRSKNPGAARARADFYLPRVCRLPFAVRMSWLMASRPQTFGHKFRVFNLMCNVTFENHHNVGGVAAGTSLVDPGNTACAVDKSAPFKWVEISP